MKRLLSAVLLLLLLAGGTVPLPAQAQAQSDDTLPSTPVFLIADPSHSDLNIGPPAEWSQPRRAATSNIQVDFVPAGGSSFYGYTCSAFPADAQTAMLFAASIWQSVITSSVTIHVQACWAGLGAGILGGAGTTYIFKNFSGGQPNTYYTHALANALSGSDLNAAPEIAAVFNSNFGSFYFGTDGHPGGLYDFASVALHEIGHGLGFYGSMSVSGGVGSWGSGGFPMIYDRFAEDGSGLSLLAYSSGSTALANALQGGAGGVYFDGPYANAANGGSRVKLFSPSTWIQGSSYSHVDTIYDGTPNALMTYSLANGEVVHAPGPISLGVLKDLGWVIPALAPPNAPTGLNLSVISTSQINLSWTDTSDNETGFMVERSTDGAAWAQIATPAANATGYSSGGLLSGTRYYYRVRAYNDAGTSAYSNMASAITQGAPQAPGSPNAVAVGTDRILLTWSDASNIESGYVIRRSPDGSTGWEEIHTTGANATFFLDTGLALGTQYFYQVKTRSASNGDSAFTSAVSATTWTASYEIYIPLVGK